MNTTGFGLTLVGAIIGLVSWRSSKTTDKYINDGHEKLNILLDDGSKRFEKSIDEGNKRLEKSIQENQKDLKVMQQETNKMINEGNKRVENILQAMQARWDQSDEFNKRMLDRILDKVA